ncbi:MAG TPA: hypothetical protein VFH71_03385 [Rhodanobacteraceae bacterium]|nr:hypothetical protein [Rhodanobacteraceae bacterium]
MPTVKRFLRPTRRIRLRLVLLAVLSLLFQQVALASYACSTADMPTPSAAMTASCDGMPMVHGQQNQALCPAHCAHQALTIQDAHAPTVPPLSMPALLPAPIALTTLPATLSTHDRATAWRLSGIPPTLRFRVLLI